jgi:hypothetical protein
MFEWVQSEDLKAKHTVITFSTLYTEINTVCCDVKNHFGIIKEISLVPKFIKLICKCFLYLTFNKGSVFSRPIFTHWPQGPGPRAGKKGCP